MKSRAVERALDAFIEKHRWKDAFDLTKSEWVNNHDYRIVDYFREKVRHNITEKSLEYYRMSYDLTARDVFDDFMLALEWNREAEKQFWLPRRHKLLPICNALQDLEDGRLDELFLSMPPRSGKTSLILFFTLWLMFRDSDRANLYSSFSDTVVKVYYNGILEVLGDPDTYRWKELFPTASVASTNAKENLIDIDRTKHYASLTCRSLYGTLNGACDVSENGILIADDLHSGIEEALNKALLDKAWMRVTNNLIPRAKETARILWIGTRWSLHDCISRRIDVIQNDPEWKDRKYLIINTPALDEFGQSNFDYLYGKGFSTEHYKRIRSQFERSDDIASWDAQYMGEPIERSGTLFEPSAMRYYNGILPDGEPDSIYMPVDPAWGGGDFVSAPVFVEYDGLIYIPAVVFNNGDKRVTIPKIAKTVIDNNVSMVYCEGTKVTSSYGDELDAQIKKRGHKCNLQNTTKHWSGLLGKAGRIYKWAPEIRDRIIFLDKAHRDKEYNAFMNNLFQFTIEGKVKHDDAPDSLAMGLEMKNNYVKAEIYQRPF